jgi:hypothetical protein
MGMDLLIYIKFSQGENLNDRKVTKWQQFSTLISQESICKNNYHSMGTPYLFNNKDKILRASMGQHWMKEL